jgi:glycosyltransferase involved in cell wall biosynthesis
VAAMPHDLLPQAQVVILGNGPQRSLLSQHPLSRAGRVFFMGARDDVAACLPAFDVFALTSHWEGEPIVLLEALACALPCVASRTPGAVEILAEGLGVLCAVGDVAGFAQSFATLQADAAARTAYGCAGLQAMQQRTHAHQAEVILSVYRKVLAQRREK